MIDINSYRKFQKRLTHEPLGGGGYFFAPLYIYRDISVTDRAIYFKLRIASNKYVGHMCAKFHSPSPSDYVLY